MRRWNQGPIPWGIVLAPITLLLCAVAFVALLAGAGRAVSVEEVDFERMECSGSGVSTCSISLAFENTMPIEAAVMGAWLTQLGDPLDGYDLDADGFALASCADGDACDGGFVLFSQTLPTDIFADGLVVLTAQGSGQSVVLESVTFLTVAEPAVGLLGLLGLGWYGYRRRSG